MPPQPTVGDLTQLYPRVRRTQRAQDAQGDETRLDARDLFDVVDPTRQVRVSPIGAHTIGAAASTPPTGIPFPTADARPIDRINRLFDERERAEDRRNGRVAAQAARTLREEAARRAAAKLRHERHLEVVETIRAYLVLTIVFCLLLIVISAGFVGWGILAGWFTWQLSR